tara:strand:- start:5035 stop:5412 length:378 start_codon:yes stop_codon:yes gene_type:complete
MQVNTDNSKKYLIIGVVVLSCLFLLSLGGGGLGWKMHKGIIEQWKSSNDSLIVIEDTLIARRERDRLKSDDSIRKIRESKIVYINADLKWKRKYEALQKDYDVILYKLYTQQYLDSLANDFLFRK